MRIIPDAAAKGAAATLCQRPIPDIRIPQIRVRNPNDAAWKLAAYLVRQRTDLRVVAVNGQLWKDDHERGDRGGARGTLCGLQGAWN